MNIEPIAFIRNDYKEKFGVPRRSGLVPMRSEVVLERKFRDANALRGLEDFTHIWLIWGFSETRRDGFSPTVRPPRLGGNVRKGVFATRSPFRPNALGLSVVGLEEIRGFTLVVTGADMMNGTPVYDIKPYLPCADSVPGASNGWVPECAALSVELPEELARRVPAEKLQGLLATLAQDPRPQYQSDGRVYTMAFGEQQVSFAVCGQTLTVLEISDNKKP